MRARLASVVSKQQLALMTMRALAACLLFTVFSVACSASEGGDPDEQGASGAAGAGSSSDDWTSTLTRNLDEDLSTELKKISGTSSIKNMLCRKADLSEKIFSLRSFDGRLCDDTFVSGLKLVGGAALLVCWDDDVESFRDSGCAVKALDAYGASRASFDKAKVVSQMEAQAADFVKKAEATSGAGSLPYYTTTKTVFCLIPASLLGPGASVHTIWCGP